MNKIAILQIVVVVLMVLVLMTGLTLTSISVAMLGFIATINLQVVKIISK